MTGALPLSPTAATTVVVQDGPDDQQPVPDIITATPDLFTVMRILLRRGRIFTSGDQAGAGASFPNQRGRGADHVAGRDRANRPN